MNQIDEQLLESIADLHGTPAGAYNIRKMERALRANPVPILKLSPSRINPVLTLL